VAFFKVGGGERREVVSKAPVAKLKAVAQAGHRLADALHGTEPEFVRF
jgi:hypothetical protein